jgi:DNA primase
MMVDRLAELSRTDSNAIESLLSGGSTAHKAVARAAQPRRGDRTAGSLVRKAVALLLRKPSLAGQQHDYAELRALESPGVPLLIDMLDLLRNNPHFTTGTVLERWRDHQFGRYLARLAQEEALVPAERLDEEFSDAMRRLRRQCLEQQIGRLKSKPPGSLSQEDKDRLKQLLLQKAVV